MVIRQAPLALLVVSSLLITNCLEVSSTRQDGSVHGELGTWPVARVVGSGARTSFYPDEVAGWQSLVDMSVFNGFQPGMTGEDAERLVGKADEVYDSRGEPHWIYRRPSAAIVVARKRKASLIGGWWWRLEARYSPPVSPEELLHPSVIEELPDDLYHHTVTIMNKDEAEGRMPAAWVYIEDGQIVRIDVSPSGARGVSLGQSPNLE